MLSYQYRKSHCGDKTAVRSSYLHNGISYTGILVCVSKLTIISSDNGLSPGRSQAIIWTSAGILIMRPLGTNFSEILIGNQTFSFKKIHSQMSSAKWHPFCLCLGVLTVMWPQWQDAFYLCKKEDHVNLHAAMLQLLSSCIDASCFCDIDIDCLYMTHAACQLF